jgi:hypothetical protein
MNKNLMENKGIEFGWQPIDSSQQGSVAPMGLASAFPRAAVKWKAVLAA